MGEDNVKSPEVFMSKKTINGITITTTDMETAYRLLDSDINVCSGLWKTDSGSIYRIQQILETELPESVKICMLSLIYTNMYIDTYEGMIVSAIDHSIESYAWKNLDFIANCMKDKDLPIDVHDADEDSWDTINLYDCTSTFCD